MKSLTFYALFVAAFAVAVCTNLLTIVADEPHSEPNDQTLRVVSYNIKRGLGNDGVTDLQRTAEVIRKLKPDFVGLQEVDEKTGRSGGVDQAVQLGKLLDMHHAFGPFMNYDGGRYGLSVLSRYPIKDATIVKLPTGHEPRVAVAAEVALPDGSSVTFVNLHFDWVKDDKFRFNQATTLKQYLNNLKTPYILLGDFNDVPESRTLKLLREGTVEAKKPDEDHFTFSSTDPTIEIDYLFAAPKSRWKVGNVTVVVEPVASDHRPVVADFTLFRAL